MFYFIKCIGKVYFGLLPQGTASVGARRGRVASTGLESRPYGRPGSARTRVKRRKVLRGTIERLFAVGHINLS